MKEGYLVSVVDTFPEMMTKLWAENAAGDRVVVIRPLALGRRRGATVIACRGLKLAVKLWGDLFGGSLVMYHDALLDVTVFSTDDCLGCVLAKLGCLELLPESETVAA